MNYRLYRQYDSAGNLLYIGVTRNPKQRMAQHRSTSPWSKDIHRVDIDKKHHYRYISSAQKAEEAAINIERPIHNVRGKLSPTYEEDMTKLQQQAKTVIDKYGLRRAAGLLGISHSTLYRYKTGAIKTVDATGKSALNILDAEARK